MSAREMRPQSCDQADLKLPQLLAVKEEEEKKFENVPSEQSPPIAIEIK